MHSLCSSPERILGQPQGLTMRLLKHAVVCAREVCWSLCMRYCVCVFVHSHRRTRGGLRPPISVAWHPSTVQPQPHFEGNMRVSSVFFLYLWWMRVVNSTSPGLRLRLRQCTGIPGATLPDTRAQSNAGKHMAQTPAGSLLAVTHVPTAGSTYSGHFAAPRHAARP